MFFMLASGSTVTNNTQHKFTQFPRSILRTKDGQRFFEISSLEILVFSSSQVTTSGSDRNSF
jgi:hypothetical protein